MITHNPELPDDDEINNNSEFDFEYDDLREMSDMESQIKKEPTDKIDEKLNQNNIDTADIYYIDREELTALLEKELRRVSKVKRNADENKFAIQSMLDEFFESYIIIGFDINENPIEITRMKTPLHQSGMGMLLQTFATKYFKESFRDR